MRKGTVISIITLLISIIGLLVALIAYFKRRSCALCDDLDDELLEEYYCDDEDCGEYCGCLDDEAEPAEEADAEGEEPTAE